MRPTTPSMSSSQCMDEKNTYIVIWTTTPWTIPANVAVAVNPTFQYSKVRAWKDGEAEILIMASDLVESVLQDRTLPGL